jgi:hypothetical protein
MSLPASEIEFWRAYYSIYPFPQEREDVRTALLAQTIANMSGRTIKDGFERKIEHFLPDYLNERNLINRTEAEQIKAEKAFVQKALETGFGVQG